MSPVSKRQRILNFSYQSFFGFKWVKRSGRQGALIFHPGQFSLCQIKGHFKMSRKYHREITLPDGMLRGGHLWKFGDWELDIRDRALGDLLNL